MLNGISMINNIKKLIAKLVLHPRLYKFIYDPYIQNIVINDYITYNEHGLISTHNCDFINNPLFQEAYKLGKQTGSWGNLELRWTVYTCCWAANKVKHLDGDFVECGVNKGGFTRSIMHYINFEETSKKFWLLDTFCGIPEGSVNDIEKKLSFAHYKYDNCYDEVVNTFKSYKNVEIIKGIVPDTLPMVKTDKICYLSIDMNCTAPEIAAAEYFWDKLVSGAIVVLDDYAWTLHYPQKLAFDEFAKRKNIEILTLPTGQGLIFKP